MNTQDKQNVISILQQHVEAMKESIIHKAGFVITADGLGLCVESGIGTPVSLDKATIYKTKEQAEETLSTFQGYNGKVENIKVAALHSMNKTKQLIKTIQ